MTKNKDNMTPKLRFKGFTDDWEQRKLGEEFDFPVITNSLSRSNLNYECGLIKNIHYGDILVKYNSILDVKIDKIPFITKIDSYKYESNLLKNGDLVFADAAEDSTVGKSVEVSNITDDLIVGGLHTIVARSKVKKAKYYLGYYMNSNSYHRQIIPLIQGSKISSISKSNLQNTKISYPEHIEEQKKIGFFLKSLDKNIALHQRKLEQLKQLKEALLQQMFPQKDENVPKLRFSNFDGEWEQHKLGDVIKSYAGGTPTATKSEYYNGNIPFIRSAEINSKDTELYLTEEGLKNSSAKLVEKGDILYALYGATSGEVGISQINGAINQAILAIKPNENYDTIFIMQWLRRQKESIINRFLQGGQGNLSGAIVKSLSFHSPITSDEQFKIGKFLKIIDEIITLHQQKLEKMKLIKQSLLQDLFI